MNTGPERLNQPPGTSGDKCRGGWAHPLAIKYIPLGVARANSFARATFAA